jgi:hypothetical protein
LELEVVPTISLNCRSNNSSLFTPFLTALFIFLETIAFLAVLTTVLPVPFTALPPSNISPVLPIN